MDIKHHTHISSNFMMDETVKYLLFVDKEVIAFLDTEDDACKAMNSMASSLIIEKKNILGVSVRVFREDLPTSINISKQDMGYLYDSSVTVIHTLQIKSVGRAIIN